MVSSADFEDRRNLRRTRRRKKQKRNWILKGIAGVFLLYLIFLVIFSFRNNVTTMIAMKGTVQEEILTDGYVFREQSIINAPVSGYLECLVSDGERVKEGQKIGAIHTGEYDPDRTRKIRELTERIARLEGGAAGGTYTGGSVMAEQKIGIAARDLSDLRQEHDIRNLAEEKENLDLLIEQKNAMEQGGETDVTALLTELKNQLYDLESNAEGGTVELYAGMSGVFCSRIDGMEDSLNFQALENLTVSHLEQLDQKPLERKESVLVGEPVCKVVDNYGWYFAANIPEKEAENIRVGSSIRMRFFDLSDTTVYGTVQAISQPEGGKVAVTVYTNRYVEGIYGISRASAEVITVSAEGIKVPVESLRVKDGQPGLYVLRLGVARFVPVTLHYRNETWAIISAVTNIGAEYQLQIYDEVVVEAKNLEEGKVVR